MSRPGWAALLAVTALGCNHPTPRSQQLDALKHYTPTALVAAAMPDAGSGTVVTNHDDMGLARLLGRHMVIRGIDDAAEFVEVRREFRAVDDAELEAFHRTPDARRRTAALRAAAPAPDGGRA